MKVRVFSTDRAAAAVLADQMAATLKDDPYLVLGLPTGRTPLLLYRELVLRYEGHIADFSRATTFNLDEFLGIPPEHPSSYRSFMDRHLFSRVNLSDSRTHFLDGSILDPEQECRRYDRAIESAGGIGLQVLGLGTNGHIGFNEPAPFLAARTHRVRLKMETRRANAALFKGGLEEVPSEALSMGMGTILQSRSIILLATGKSKARCVQGMLEGPLTTKLPASFLQIHRDVEVVLDAAAASLIK